MLVWRAERNVERNTGPEVLRDGVRDFIANFETSIAVLGIWHEITDLPRPYIGKLTYLKASARPRRKCQSNAIGPRESDG